MSCKIPNYPDIWESGVDGPAPAIWFGGETPDGSARPFSLVPVGSTYISPSETTQWVKTTDRGAYSDWTAAMGVVAQYVTVADFTDGGSTTGTLTLDGIIPEGALVHRVILSEVTGFTGNVSAVLMVGDGTDDDRYNAVADIDVFTTATALDGGAPQGTVIHAAQKQPVLTITASTDFTLVTAGAFFIKIFYMK
jgi:hypothetical protein